MFLPTNLPDLAIQTRTDAKTLLWGHTVFRMRWLSCPRQRCTVLKKSFWSVAQPTKARQLPW